MTTDDLHGFPTDAEVTVTVTGRVVLHHAGGLVVEYVSNDGWPDRISFRLDSADVSAAVAGPPAAEDVARRRDAYRRMGDAFVCNPEQRARIYASAPYGGITVGEVA